MPDYYLQYVLPPFDLAWLVAELRSVLGSQEFPGHCLHFTLWQQKAITEEVTIYHFTLLSLFQGRGNNSISGVSKLIFLRDFKFSRQCRIKLRSSGM
jgi:hypothetical protein